LKRACFNFEGLDVQATADMVTAKLQELTDKHVPTSIPTLSSLYLGGMQSVSGCGAARNVLVVAAL
jgi:hypothetical protein